MFVYIIEVKQETELQQGLELFFQKYSHLSLEKYTVKKTDNETIKVEVIFDELSLTGEQHHELNKIFSQETKLFSQDPVPLTTTCHGQKPLIDVSKSKSSHRYMEIKFEQPEDMIQKCKELLLKYPRALLQYRIHQTESKVQIEYSCSIRILNFIYSVFKIQVSIKEKNVDDDIDWLDWIDFNSSINVIHKM